MTSLEKSDPRRRPEMPDLQEVPVPEIDRDRKKAPSEIGIDNIGGFVDEQEEPGKVPHDPKDKGRTYH